MNNTTYLNKNEKAVDIAVVTCILFTFFSLIFNVFYSTILWPLLPNIGVNLLTLLLAFIISSVIFVIRYSLKKSPLISKLNLFEITTIFYTTIFIIFNVLTFFIKDVWNLYTILIILALSFALTIIKLYVNISNFLLKSLIYYLIISIPYFIIALVFAGYDKGNQIIIVFATYTIIYAIINISAYLLISAKLKRENESKKYTKQFK